MMKRYYGWRGSGKTQALVDRAWAAAQQGLQVVFISPNRKSSFYAEALLDRTHPTDTMLDIWFIPAAAAIQTLQRKKFDLVLVDEADYCLNAMLGGKIKGISLTLSEDV